MTSALALQCSTNWAMKTHTLGAGQFIELIVPMKGMKHMNIMWTADSFCFAPQFEISGFVHRAVLCSTGAGWRNLAPDPMKIITIVIKSKGGFRLERKTEASTMTNIRAGSRTNQLRPQLSLITGQCSRTAPPPVLFSYEFSWEDLK